MPEDVSRIVVVVSPARLTCTSDAASHSSSSRACLMAWVAPESKSAYAIGLGASDNPLFSGRESGFAKP